jgi:hypothetical protein
MLRVALLLSPLHAQRKQFAHLEDFIYLFVFIMFFCFYSQLCSYHHCTLNEATTGSHTRKPSTTQGWEKGGEGSHTPSGSWSSFSEHHLLKPKKRTHNAKDYAGIPLKKLLKNS